jgi:hypothetical protein
MLILGLFNKALQTLEFIDCSSECLLAVAVKVLYVTFTKQQAVIP